VNHVFVTVATSRFSTVSNGFDTHSIGHEANSHSVASRYFDHHERSIRRNAVDYADRQSLAAANAVRGTSANSPMSVVIDKRAGGLTMLGSFYATSSDTFYGAAYEVPTATGVDAPVGSTNNQNIQTITGLANIISTSSALIEAGGAGGGTMLVVNFAPAS
jgi:hypothetical protein